MLLGSRLMTAPPSAAALLCCLFDHAQVPLSGASNSSCVQIFSHDKWERHRSPWKYVEQIATLPFSHTIRAIALPLLWIVVVTLYVGVSFTFADRGWVPRWLVLPRLSANGASPTLALQLEVYM